MKVNEDPADYDYCRRMGQALFRQVKNRYHLGVETPEIKEKQNKKDKQ